jgi:hypothetical protein
VTEKQLLLIELPAQIGKKGPSSEGSSSRVSYRGKGRVGIGRAPIITRNGDRCGGSGNGIRVGSSPIISKSKDGPGFTHSTAKKFLS